MNRFGHHRYVRFEERAADADVPQRQPQHGLQRPPELAHELEPRTDATISESPSHNVPRVPTALKPCATLAGLKPCATTMAGLKPCATMAALMPCVTMAGLKPCATATVALNGR
jgi:hypothetical protein